MATPLEAQVRVTSSLAADPTRVWNGISTLDGVNLEMALREIYGAV